MHPGGPNKLEGPWENEDQDRIMVVTEVDQTGIGPTETDLKGAGLNQDLDEEIVGEETTMIIIEITEIIITIHIATTTTTTTITSMGDLLDPIVEEEEIGEDHRRHLIIIMVIEEVLRHISVVRDP